MEASLLPDRRNYPDLARPCDRNLKSGRGPQGELSNVPALTVSIFPPCPPTLAPERHPLTPVSDVALSRDFVTGSRAILVTDGVGFHVQVIKALSTLRFERDTANITICSIAQGKLAVKISEEPEFKIGPHGLFKIPAGGTVSVRNLSEADAVVHIVTVSET